MLLILMLVLILMLGLLAVVGKIVTVLMTLVHRRRRMVGIVPVHQRRGAPRGAGRCRWVSKRHRRHGASNSSRWSWYLLRLVGIAAIIAAIVAAAVVVVLLIRIVGSTSAPSAHVVAVVAAAVSASVAAARTARRHHRHVQAGRVILRRKILTPRPLCSIATVTGTARYRCSTRRGLGRRRRRRRRGGLDGMGRRPSCWALRRCYSQLWRLRHDCRWSSCFSGCLQLLGLTMCRCRGGRSWNVDTC